MNLDPDLIFVIGVIVGLLAFPALLNSYTHGRTPTLTLLLAVVAAGMIVYAMSQKPSGAYTAETIPKIFVKVLRGG